MLRETYHDLSLGFRRLLREPGFATAALITLGLGIGAVTSVFTAVNALLLRPLPLIRDQDRLLQVTQTLNDAARTGPGFNYADYLEVRARSRTLANLWVLQDKTVILEGPDEPERLMGAGITPEAFGAMGVEPVLGRQFRPEDDAPGAPPVALLGHGLWQRRFGGDPDIVGRVIRLNGVPTEIIGVMPPDWRYPEVADLWTPLGLEAKEEMRGTFYLAGYGMRREGVPIAQVQAELDTLAADLAREHPRTNEGVGLRVRSAREEAVEDTARLTWLLFGAVGFVFLIACANVANLLLVRNSARSKEIAIRLALGAPRRRIVRQLLTEHLVLGLLGGAAGLLLALWSNDLMVATIPVELPFWLRFSFDPRVFAFVALASVLATLLFGLAPALQASRPCVVEELKEGGRSCAAVSRRVVRLRTMLVAAEVALALVLLVGAGLMMRSFLAARSIDPGFAPAGVLTFRTGIPLAMEQDRERVVQFFADVTARLRQVPGVRGAAAISTLPGPEQSMMMLLPEGMAEPARALQSPGAYSRIVTPGSFAALGIPLLAGRDFDEHDRTGKPMVAVVDAQFSRAFLGGRDPVGTRFRILKYGGEASPWVEIVGVAGEVRHHLDRPNVAPTVYFPHAQEPSNFMSVVLRTDGDPTAFADIARREVLAVRADIPIYYVLTMEEVLTRVVWVRRFFGYLFTVFAGVAVLLAAIGIYGVTAYAVTQRTREIGLRMALGAHSRDVVGMVIRQGALQVGGGLLAGLVAALSLARLLSGYLYGVSPHDPPTFASVPLLLAGVALLACWLPGRRATRIDPMVALRGE